MVLNDSLRRLLETPFVVRMSVIDSEGYPHTVPVWFGVDGDEIIIFSYYATRKIKYAQANPKGSISFGGDPAGTEGYLLKGEFSIEADQNRRWEREITNRYESDAHTDELMEEWKDLEMLVMRFKIHKVIKL